MPEFVAVSALVTLVFAALLQLSFALHVRTVLVDCVAEGARYGALADKAPADGAARARELITGALSPRFAGDVEAERGVVDGLAVVRVSARAPLPVVGLLGTATSVTVEGHGALAVLPPVEPVPVPP